VDAPFSVTGIAVFIVWLLFTLTTPRALTSSAVSEMKVVSAIALVICLTYLGHAAQMRA
jgi:hypothetical protein